MKKSKFRKWLDNLGKAWVEKDPDLATSIFSKSGTYQSTPFGKPMRGRKQIRNYWQSGVDTQDDIKFDYEIITAKGDSCVAHAWGSLKQDGKPQKWDGIFWVTLNSLGLCTSFREWWHSENV